MRYARDYRVICGPSTEAALAQLEALRDNDAAVAIVMAARGTADLKGEAFLERVHDIHPHAKRALLIPWGGWSGTRKTADAIRTAMALGHIDYYALKPWSTPDELFHRLVSEFLQEWRRQNAPGRRQSTVVSPIPGRRAATSCATSSRATACRMHSTPATRPRESSCSVPAGSPEPTFRWSSFRTGRRSSTRRRRILRSTGPGCERSSTSLASSTS